MHFQEYTNVLWFVPKLLWCGISPEVYFGISFHAHSMWIHTRNVICMIFNNMLMTQHSILNYMNHKIVVSERVTNIRNKLKGDSLPEAPLRKLNTFRAESCSLTVAFFQFDFKWWLQIFRILFKFYQLKLPMFSMNYETEIPVKRMKSWELRCK